MSAQKTSGKTIDESRVTLSMLMNPQDANPLGNVHGGVIMKLVDEAGGLCSMRHACSPVVTVAVDSMTFLNPIYVGNLVTLSAELTYAGRTSMEARVQVTAEDVTQGIVTTTNWAYLVYVAIDKQGRPREVLPLLIRNEEERARMERAKARQAYRLQQKKQEQADKT